MLVKPVFQQVAELSVAFTITAILVLSGCGGGGGGGGNNASPAVLPNQNAFITPYKGTFLPGALVSIKDANGTPVTIISGGTVNASGVVNVTYGPNVIYPLLVEVTGTYFNEITQLNESATVPLRGLIATQADASNVPVTIITETAVADLLNQVGGSFSAAHPIQVASAVNALDKASAMFGITYASVPVFNVATHQTSDPNTIGLSALALVANNIAAGATLIDRVKSLANTMATLNPASAPVDVINQAAMNSAVITMTSGASSVSVAGVATPPAPMIKSTNSAFVMNRVSDAINTIVGAWYTTDSQQHNIVITLFTNGDYVEAEDGTSNPTGQSGMERGTYTWNAASGVITTTCPLVDTNGQWGLSHQSLGTCSGSAVSAVVAGNTLTVDNGNQILSLTRAIDATNPYVGSWSIITSQAHNVVLTLFSSGRYVQTEDGVSDAIGQSGMERGTFSWNSSTGIFSSNCPSVDTNGGWGLSHQNNGICFGLSGGANGASGASAPSNAMTLSNLSPVSIITPTTPTAPARYSAVPGGCVLDNTTGLIWEVKTTDGGLRDWNNKYTNFNSTLGNQVSIQITPTLAGVVPATQAQIDAPTNSVGFVKAVNATNLCGYSNWRIPTQAELATIRVPGAAPTIDKVWFPNTLSDTYWTSSPWTVTGFPASLFAEGALVVIFNSNQLGNDYRVTPFPVRLVRG
jgi:hypothetical protein